MSKVTSLLVYCGANEGSHPAYREAAIETGRLLARENIALVYGGGSVGLMGIIADTVLQSGGKAIGVIPRFLDAKEIGHKSLTEMHVVNSMHERKAVMERLCDAAIALPGGFGTMDEIFEMLTWAQLGLHRKPLGLLNVNGYYDHFIAHLDKMVEDGFLKSANRSLLIISDSIEGLITLLRKADPVIEEKWMQKGQE
jgi:uncharacterized protein (TIGR00730 family)